jgi:phosphoserine phosphatase RsbU/P
VKIRSKLLLLEGSITLILFFSLLFSLMSLINLSKINGVYKTILDKGQESKHLRLKIEEILYHPNSNYEDFVLVEEQWSDLSFTFRDLRNSRIYNAMDRDFKLSLKELNEQWITLESQNTLSEYIQFFTEYYSLHENINMSFSSFAASSEDTTSLAVADNLTYLAEEIIKLEKLQLKILRSIQAQIPELIRRRVTFLLVSNGFAVLLCIVISFYFGHSFMENIRRIRVSINKVSGGEFSHKLQISSNDEFGRLARDFNSVTEALWAKLEAVQSILHDVGDSISNEIEVNKVEKAIVYLGLKSTDASGAALYLFNEEKTELYLNYGVGDFRPPYSLGGDKEKTLPFKTSDEVIDSFKEIPIKVGETMIGEAAQTGRPSMIKRTYSSSFARPHNHPYHINSAIAIPIRMGNVVYGVLSLIHTGDDSFSDLEMANAQSFCELAAISIDNLMKYNEMLEVYELNREIDIAAEIQQNLLPQQIPQLRNSDMSFKTRTCRGINGDFYDCYMLDRENVLITVCEVAGKGVPAALVITMIKTILKLVAKSGMSAAEIITKLNRNITEKIRIENIAALSLLLYNQSTGAISYASAGNQPLLIYRSDDDTYEDNLPLGIPVGLDKKATYEESKIRLNSEDFLMLFTDGIPEARSYSGKEYGIHSLKDRGRSFKNETAEKIVSEIIDDLDFFHRDSHQWDDQTIFTLKRGVDNQ